MKVEKNLYESPKVEAMELIVEQNVLQSSIPDIAPTYGGFGEEEEW